MSRFLNHKLQDLEPYTPGEQPKGIDGLLKLNTNESPFAPSVHVRHVLNAFNKDDLRLYPDPTCNDFLTALANTFDVKQTQVTAGNGSDELLAFAFAAFCENGAAFADITYGFYKVFAQLYGVNAQKVPLKDDFSIDVSDYKDIKGTIFVANPNAPTGIALGLNDIKELLCQDENRLVVVDEAYVDFGAESAVLLLKEFDNLLVIGTFSKSRSLAGARLGYAIASQHIIEDLNKIKYSFNPYSINKLSLLIGEATLKDGDYLKSCAEKIIVARENTVRALSQLGFTFTDSSANFLFAQPPAAISAQDYYEKLRQNNILVRYFDAPRINNYVRITVGKASAMERLVEVTGQILGELQ